MEERSQKGWPSSSQSKGGVNSFWVSQLCPPPLSGPLRPTPLPPGALFPPALPPLDPMGKFLLRTGRSPLSAGLFGGRILTPARLCTWRPEAVTSEFPDSEKRNRMTKWVQLRERSRDQAYLATKQSCSSCHTLVLGGEGRQYIWAPRVIFDYPPTSPHPTVGC